jgi:hypothetical protein
MAAAVAAAEQAASNSLQRLSQEHAGALAAALAAAEQGWRQKLAAAQAAHQQELSAATSTAACDQQSMIAALTAKHEAEQEQLAQRKRAAEQSASSQASPAMLAACLKNLALLCPADRTCLCSSMCPDPASVATQHVNCSICCCFREFSHGSAAACRLPACSHSCQRHRPTSPACQPS